MNGIKDWLGLVAAVVGLLVGVKLLVANPIEARLDRIEARMEAHQAETNRRFDALLAAIMDFDRRVARLEGRLDAQDAGEQPATQP